MTITSRLNNLDFFFIVPLLFAQIYIYLAYNSDIAVSLADKVFYLLCIIPKLKS